MEQQREREGHESHDHEHDTGHGHVPEVPDILRVDPESERQQVERLRAFKADRDAALVEQRLDEIRAAARGTENLLPVLRQALKDRCSMGEACAAMRDVFGEYQPSF